MPPKLPQVSGKEVIAALQRPGFVVVRQRGSHVTLKKRVSANEEIGCVVPLHNPLASGSLRSRLKQARVTIEEFLEQL